MDRCRNSYCYLLLLYIDITIITIILYYKLYTMILFYMMYTVVIIVMYIDNAAIVC